MMGDVMKIDFPSWKKVSAVFDEAASGASADLSSVVSSTTDPAACKAASGLATVDGAVAIMLSVFGEVMQNTVVTSVRDGLTGEAEGLIGTQEMLQAMEDVNEDAAHGMEVD